TREAEGIAVARVEPQRGPAERTKGYARFELRRVERVIKGEGRGAPWVGRGAFDDQLACERDRATERVSQLDRRADRRVCGTTERAHAVSGPVWCDIGDGDTRAEHRVRAVEGDVRYAVAEPDGAVGDDVWIHVVSAAFSSETVHTNLQAKLALDYGRP
ncbi:MAG: hypothetical protein ACI82G_002927, partial [Bradymonadia bacterium]